jgi:hypothetical protein
MAWTASSQVQIGSDGLKVLSITYSDGTKNITNRYEINTSYTPEFVSKLVRDKINYLTIQDQRADQLSSGTIVPASPDPVINPPAPTQSEIDRRQWINDYNKWVKIKQTLIDTGILTGSEAPLVTLKDRVKTNFKPAYLDFI